MTDNDKAREDFEKWWDTVSEHTIMSMSSCEYGFSAAWNKQQKVIESQRRTIEEKDKQISILDISLEDALHEILIAQRRANSFIEENVQLQARVSELENQVNNPTKWFHKMYQQQPTFVDGGIPRCGDCDMPKRDCECN